MCDEFNPMLQRALSGPSGVEIASDFSYRFEISKA